MIIQALITKGENRPVLQLLTNEFEPDLHFYKNFWIEPAIVKNDGNYTVQISVPDRQENLATIDPLSDDIVEYLKEALPKSNYRIDIIFKEFETDKEEKLDRPGDIPVSFDFSGRINEYIENFRNGKIDEAIMTLDSLQKIDEKFPFINLYKAEMYIRMSKLEEAEKFLNKELEICPDNFIAYCSAGYLYRVIGNPTKAKESYVKSLKIYSNYMNSILSITYLFSEPTELEFLFARAYKVNPSHPGIDQILTEREIELGDKTKVEFLEAVSKKSAKFSLDLPIYIPGMTKETTIGVDPTIGDLTEEEVFKFCLEEIIMDGKLNEKEKRTLNDIKRALNISDEVHSKIFKEVELNYRQKKFSGEDELNEKVLYKRIIERVLADGKVTEAEKAILKKVSFVLMIDKDVHQEVVKEVMAEKKKQ